MLLACCRACAALRAAIAVPDGIFLGVTQHGLGLHVAAGVGGWQIDWRSGGLVEICCWDGLHMETSLQCNASFNIWGLWWFGLSACWLWPHPVAVSCVSYFLGGFVGWGALGTWIAIGWWPMVTSAFLLVAELCQDTVSL